jgi:hypothetical protein
MSALAPISSALPPGADVEGKAAGLPVLTLYEKLAFTPACRPCADPLLSAPDQLGI